MGFIQKHIFHTLICALLLGSISCGKVDEANHHLEAMNRNTDQMNTQINQMNAQMAQLNTQILQMNSQMLSLNQSLATMSVAISSFVQMSEGLATQFLQMVLSNQNNHSIENSFPNIDDVMENLENTDETNPSTPHQETRP